ncbi:MAG TPA: HD domain-containing phosphohydrolase [Gemmatimonadaceae bacterium]|jgi:HD-GYP domain-containing protein (c-di-GMP phosphodiesterase class II)
MTADDGERQETANTRRAGRALVVAIHAASRVMKLYPPEHQAVQKSLAELAAAAAESRATDADLEVRVHGEFIFVNGTRLRLDLSNYSSFGRVLELFRSNGVGVLRVLREAAPREWFSLLTLLTTLGGSAGADADELARRLHAAGVDAFEVAADAEAEEDVEEREVAKAAARRTYAQSVALTKDVINSVRMGRVPSARKIKRAVQTIVDQVLTEEASLIGLTTLREYDEYTYTHSVNVCIFAVALGKRIGMSKLQLYELGVGALMHDIGKSRVPTDLLQKSTALDEDDWRRIIAHPWLGMLTLFQLRGQQELPYRAMVVAHEHHMRRDFTGYPRVIRPRQLAMTSKIVAVADAYDAATSRRSYQTKPYPPSAVLQEMRDNPKRGLDPVVVKAFITLLGIYPSGTLVVLDTFELAVVLAANPNPEMLSRPRVVIVSDGRGNLLQPPIETDLAAIGPDGQFARTIIKTADPDRYGIRVSDYVV